MEKTETEKTLKQAADDFERGISTGSLPAVAGSAVKAATAPVAVVKDVVKSILPW